MLGKVGETILENRYNVPGVKELLEVVVNESS